MNNAQVIVSNLIIKKENDLQNTCQCCLNRINEEEINQNERNTLQKYLHMITYCFKIDIVKKENKDIFICEICAAKLRDTCVFRNQIEEAQARLIQDAKVILEEPPQPYFDTFDDVQEGYSSGEVYKQPETKPVSKRLLKLQKQSSKRKKEKEKEEKERLRFPCLVCKQRFESMKILRNHRLTHRTQEYVCSTCGKTFKSGSSFRAHQFTHSNKVPCNICGKMFSQNSMRSHQLIHKGYLIYACRLCPKRFNSHLPRNKHRAEVHGVPMPVHRCGQCPGEFNCASALTKHVRRMHNCEKNYTCSHCNMAFFYLAELKNHMIVHTGERNHECELCHKKFGRQKTMKQHMKTHANDTIANATSGPSVWGSFP